MFKRIFALLLIISGTQAFAGHSDQGHHHKGHHSTAKGQVPDGHSSSEDANTKK